VKTVSGILPDPKPTHDCGLCDSSLEFAGYAGAYATFLCTNPRCHWGHTSKDCCENDFTKYPSLKNWYEVKEGDRIVLVEMLDDPCPLDPGVTGTVTDVNVDVGQLHVEWDNGRTLMLVPPDAFNIINDYVITEEP
jgi:hypothetical protein